MTDTVESRLTDRVKAWLVLATAVAFVLSPVISQSFGGFEPGQFPVPQEDPPAQPAGYAFSIWTLIYGWLIVHGAFGVWQRADHVDWDRTRLPLIVSLGVGFLWIPVALRSPLLATLLIWVMHLAAIRALTLAPERDYWLAKVPIAIYAGWLTAASWVSIALIGAGWGIGPDAVAWAWIAVVCMLVFAGFVLWTIGPSPEYAAPIVWALIALAVSNVGSEWLLATGALVGAAGLGALSWFIKARR